MKLEDKTMYNTYCKYPLQLLFLTAAFVICKISAIQEGIPQDAILINPCQSDDITAGETWNEDIVPYTLDEQLGNISIAVQQSIYLIESKTCLRYVPQTNQQDYIRVKHNSRCCSHRGRVGYGRHDLFLHPSCTTTSEQLGTILAMAGSVDWELLTTTQQCGCGGSMYIDHPDEGIINSPGYPADYSNSDQCVWKLWISSDMIVELEIVDFELEDEIGCNYDFVEFIQQSVNGAVEKAPLKRCGTTIENKLNFTAGSVSIRFVSDMDIQAKGFQIKYKTYSDAVNKILCSEFNGGCSHQCISDSNGVKHQCACSPGYKLSDDQRTCEDIDECSIQKGGCDQRCTNTDGSFFCHCHLGNGLSSDNAAKCEACGGSFNELSGSFTSPPHPSFPTLQNCNWVINILPRYFLKVEITNISIPVSKRCVENYLKLQHGSFNFKKRICGQFSSISYIVKQATGSSSYFKFRTGKSNFLDYTGFALTYTQVLITELTQEELDTVYVNGIAIPYQTNNWLS